MFELIRRAYQERSLRVPTPALNNIFVPDLAAKLAGQSPCLKLGVRYITQKSSSPPTFLVFVAGHAPLHFSTERFLINQLRQKFGFYAAPIRIEQRLKKRREGH